MAAFHDALRAAREQYRRDTLHEATDRERAAAPGSVGRAAAGHSQAGRRRAAILALVERGATEGERQAASAALERIDDESRQHRATMDRLDSETYG